MEIKIDEKLKDSKSQWKKSLMNIFNSGMWYLLSNLSKDKQCDTNLV